MVLSKKNCYLIVFLMALLPMLSACATVSSPIERQSAANYLASMYQWQPKIIQTSLFDLISYQSTRHLKQKLLTVYIEGDGLAWLTKNIISTDPTPINLIGLKLALEHPGGVAVYLARPCQFVGGATARNCHQRYWTDGRFSEEVVESTNQALGSLKAEFGASELQLVAYSGGAAVAALVAARRDDVTKLITVAGNLDHKEWAAHHKISRLLDSLNPADYHKQLESIEQVHFVGADDEVIPLFLAQHFVAEFKLKNKVDIIVVPGFNHRCCWSRDWSKLWASIIDNL